jgi:hypothetical protein
VSATQPLSGPTEAVTHDLAARRARYGATLALTVTLSVSAFLILSCVVLLIARPQNAGLGNFALVVNQQNQTAKSLLYAAVFLVILPAALTLVPRLADAIAEGPNAAALSLVTAAVVGSLAAVLILVRASAGLPWGDGLKPLLAALIAWSLAASVTLARVASRRPWPALLRAQARSRLACIAAGVLVFAVLLGLTSRSSLHGVPLVLGVLLAVAVLAAASRMRKLSLPRWLGRSLEVVWIALAALAIANVVIYHATGQPPRLYYPPGLIQNQQDFLLGSANQLRGGGALLVNVPVSQYGVGMIYFLGAWFHLAPIGYSTLGFLDSVLTVLFYLAGYAVLRTAGVGRPLAIGTISLGVVALVLGLLYPVGSLPETGPLRFGLPMGVLLPAVVAARRPRLTRAADAITFCLVAISAVWAFEAFAYTLVVFAAIAAARAWLRPAGTRRGWLLRQAALAAGACVTGHLVLAAATLVGSGHLPDWGQYIQYLRSFLLGGQAGVISYGFTKWSPGLAVGVAAFASASGVLLLVHRAPAVVRARGPILIGLAGSTAYAIALLSYTDNRSATYLLAYVTLPILLAAALWLALLMQGSGVRSGLAQRGGLAFALGVSVLLISSAWPLIGRNVSQSALARAYPGGGLSAALHRLWHPPPIDPRAPEAIQLLDRYIPGRRVLILLPTAPDLPVEIEMRGGRVNSMFISDPVDDSLVLADRMPRLRSELARLRAGQRLLTDRSAFSVLADLRAHPTIDPAKHPVDGGDQQTEWLLSQIDQRWRIVPIHRGPGGLIVAELVPRRQGA